MPFGETLPGVGTGDWFATTFSIASMESQLRFLALRSTTAVANTNHAAPITLIATGLGNLDLLP